MKLTFKVINSTFESYFEYSMLSQFNYSCSYHNFEEHLYLVTLWTLELTLKYDFIDIIHYKDCVFGHFISYCNCPRKIFTFKITDYTISNRHSKSLMSWFYFQVDNCDLYKCILL